MSSIAFTNIATLVTNDSSLGEGDLGILRKASLVVEDGLITEISQGSPSGVDREVDCTGKTLLPGFVDSHSHLIFAGDRADEFEARSHGQKYTAGGIASTVKATRQASDAQLRENAQHLLNEALASGTTTIEIKSGYGLDVATEERSLRIAAELTDEVTYLGAHVVAPEFAANPDDYVDLVVGEMLEACAPHSKWIDVFCDRGAFTTEQSRRILEEGIKKGLHPRIHLNQLEQGDGVAMAIELDCASADHLTYLTDDDISALAASSTVAGLVPGADFSTRAPHYPRGRDLIDAGATVALSPDCNPGSSFTTNMPFCIALAVREMHMTVDESLFAATMGGAIALRRDDVGHLSIGARANFALLNAPSYIHLAYRPGVPLISTTWKDGNVIFTKGDIA